MILVIDIGNTNVALAGVRGEEVTFTAKVPTVREWDKEEYHSRIAPILEGKSFRGAILSSVVPQITLEVQDAAAELIGSVPVVLSREMDTGLVLDVDAPERVGIDRLVDSAWAAQHMPLPAVTADMGTATTLNVILPGNIFAGGVICAGMQTGLSALAQRAAQLPALKPAIPERMIGKNTEECMLIGAVVGTAGTVDGLVAAIEDELGQKVSLLITGGGGEYADRFIRHEHVYDKDVILKGLALIYERVKPC